MAGGVIAPASGGQEYPGKFTFRVFYTCIIAATGGLIFGYDLGISGRCHFLLVCIYIHAPVIGQ